MILYIRKITRLLPNGTKVKQIFDKILDSAKSKGIYHNDMYVCREICKRNGFDSSMVCGFHRDTHLRSH